MCVVVVGYSISLVIKGEVKNVHKNCLIQKKMERPLGSHDSQLTQGTPAVCKRRVN